MRKHFRKFQLKIETVHMKSSDRDEMVRIKKHMLMLKNRLLGAQRDSKVYKILQTELNANREKFSMSYAFVFYKTTLFLGKHKHTQYFPFYPEHDSILTLRDEMVNKLTSDRIERKKMNVVIKEFNGIRYETVSSFSKPKLIRYDEDGNPLLEPKVQHKIMPGLIGGGSVFTKKRTILGLIDSEEYNTRITRPKKPYDKAHYVGVEIELICSVTRERLNEIFVEKKLSGCVYVKSDSSIHKEKETEHCHEVTLIGKESTINSIIDRVCGVLNSSEVKSYVNDTCGLHVHMDIRNRDAGTVFANCVHTLPVLSKMIPHNRISNRYCKMNTSPVLSDNGDRYQAINPSSVRSHSTIEIRMHSGTTNAMKINNWINILMAIANTKENINIGVTKETIQEKFGLKTELVDYINKRIEKFNNKALTTKDDHRDLSA